jgi:predicted TIM-barrel fold metal-dependent hydrolase
MKIIDPHLHLFDLSQGNYHWLQETNPPFWPDKQLIHKSFNEKDITLDNGLALAGFVHIEAGFDNLKPWREIQWLERSITTPFKAIASADLMSDTKVFTEQITKLLQFSSVIGIRHIFDDDALKIIQHRNTLANIKLIAQLGLIFELQMPIADKNAVSKFSQLLSQCPTLNVVINHCGFPMLNANSNDSWRDGLTILAEHDAVNVKCSGWEMMTRHYQPNELADVVHQVIDIFSINNVMLASNFPLTLFSRDYQALWQLYRHDLQLSDATFCKLSFENAASIYKLNNLQ